MRKISSVKSVQTWSEHSPSFTLHLSSPFLRFIRVHRKPEESEHQQLQSAPALPPQHPAHGRWAAPFINTPCCASFINPLFQTKLFPFQHTVHECYPVSIKTITSWVLRQLLLEYHNQSLVVKSNRNTIQNLQKTFKKKMSFSVVKKVIAFALRVQKFWMTQILLMDAQSLKYAASWWLIDFVLFFFFFLKIISKWTLSASDCSMIRTHSIISYPVEVVIYVCILYICFVPYSTVWLSLRPPVEIYKVGSCSTSWSFNE